MESCTICQRLLTIKDSPLLIKEFEHSFLVLGDHQFFNGYCVVHYKKHVRDLYELSPQIQSELFLEVMQAAKAINKAFSPWKLNYSCYGNVVEHIHWHIFPRYESDPDLRMHPWLHSADFGIHSVSKDQMAKNIELIKNCLLE